MQIATIKIPDGVPHEVVERAIKDLEAKLEKEVQPDKNESSSNSVKLEEEDSFLKFLDNIDEYAVDTGRTDGSINHDHYLYGSPKRV